MATIEELKVKYGVSHQDETRELINLSGKAEQAIQLGEKIMAVLRGNAKTAKKTSWYSGAISIKRADDNINVLQNIYKQIKPFL